MFKSIFEVVFLLKYASTEISDEVVDDDQDDESESFFDAGEDVGDAEDEDLVTATIVCTSELTLPDFISQLMENKSKVLADLGYPETDTESSIVRVDLVTGDNLITMLPQTQMH